MFEEILALEKNFASRYYNILSKFDPTVVTDGQMNAAIKANGVFGGKKEILTIDELKGEARISITGPLSVNGPGFIEWLFGIGGTSYLEIKDSLKEIESMNHITKVILNMDTPGGSVNGVDDVHSQILKLKSLGKEVIAINHGTIASAGYWIASAADKIYAISPTNLTGSIGVIVVTHDHSEAYAKAGIKQVVVTSENAPNKHLDVTTPKGFQELKELIDAIEGTFFTRIASGRGITVEDVINNYGQGKTFVAKDFNNKNPDALERKMIDGIVDEESLSIQNEVIDEDNPEVEMTLQEILAKFPSVAAEIKIATDTQVSAAVNKVKADLKETIDFCSKFIGNAEYGEIVSKKAIEVIGGNAEISSLKTLVDFVDHSNAEKKAKAAAAETTDAKDIPSQTTDLKSEIKDGEAKNTAEAEALMKKYGGQ